GWQNRKRINWRVIAGGIILVASSIALITLWWFVARHTTLGFWFGTPEAASPMGEPLSLEGIVAQWTELEISFWGLCGWNMVQPAMMPLLGLCWIAASAGAGITALDGAYPRATLLSAAALPADIHPVNANLGDRIELLGYQVRFGRAGTGDLVEVIPYWQTTA